MTGDELTYDILDIITKFGQTDRQRYDEDWIRNKRDQLRAYFIQMEHRKQGFINPVWLQDLGVVQFTPVKESDIDYGVCGSCNISKAVLPQHIPLYNPDSQNEDNGLKIMTPCGRDMFYYLPLEVIRNIPKEHPRSKFYYYFTLNNNHFINKVYGTGLKPRVMMVAERPADINVINNLEVPSGALVVGTVYKVINYQIVHNSLAYMPGQTFTAVNALYTGAGSVVLANPVELFSESTSTYPVTNAMARAIVLEMCTKEFGVEESKISDYKNDMADDNTQVTNRAAQI
jgi:hypothetical protein